MAATFRATGKNDQVTTAASFSVTCTINSGDAVAIAASWATASTTTPTLATTGGAGSDVPTLVYGPVSINNFKMAVWLLPAATAARTGVTLTWASSSPAFADAFVWSFFGLTSPTFDKANSSLTSTGTVITSAATGTLSSADEFAIGYAASNGAVNGVSGTWTSDGITTNTASGGEHQILTSTASITANFTAPSSNSHVSLVATFMAGGAAPAPLVAPLVYSRVVGRPPTWQLSHVVPSDLPIAVPTVVVFEQAGTVRISAPSQDTSPVSYTGITVGSSNNRALLVTVGFMGVGASTPTGITATWDQGGTNQSMTSLGSQVSTTSGYVYHFFGLLAPTSGNKTLQVAWSGGASPAQTVIDAISFSNVNQASLTAAFPNFVSNSGTGTTTSIAVTSASGHIPVAMMASDFSVFTISSPSDTPLYTDTASGTPSAAQYSLAPAATENFSWTLSTSAPWTAIGIDVAPPSTGNAYTMPAATGVFALTGIAAITRFGHAAVATTATFTLTGVNNILRYGHVMPAAKATFTLTGNAAGMLRSYVMPAAKATFTLNGIAAITRYGHVLTATNTTFSLTGIGMIPAVTMPVVKGTFTLSGVNAITRFGHNLVAGTGQFVLTGYAAGLSTAHNYILTAAVSSFTVNGQASTLKRTYVVPHAVGAFSVNGQAATLKRTYVMPAATGAFAVNGQAAILRYGHVLTAAKAAVNLTGVAVNLTATRRLTAVNGVFTLSGKAAGLAYGRRVAATATAFTLSGQTVTLRYGRVMPAAKGTFTLTGTDTNLIRSGNPNKVMPATVGPFTLSGKDVNLKLTRVLKATVTTFTVGGQAAGLRRDRTLAAAAGVFTLSGKAVTLRYNRVLTATPGTFVLTGIPVQLIAGLKNHYTLAAGTGAFNVTGYAATLSRVRAPRSEVLNFGRPAYLGWHI